MSAFEPVRAAVDPSLRMTVATTNGWPDSIKRAVCL
jgi:hypothetical protein